MFFVLMLPLDPFLNIFENVFSFKQYCCEKLLTILCFWWLAGNMSTINHVFLRKKSKNLINAPEIRWSKICFSVHITIECRYVRGLGVCLLPWKNWHRYYYSCFYIKRDHRSRFTTYNVAFVKNSGHTTRGLQGGTGSRSTPNLKTWVQPTSAELLTVIYSRLSGLWKLEIISYKH